MSAIFGFVQLDSKPADEELLRRAGEALKHRAVDGQFMRVNGPVGLGHCLLQTTSSSPSNRKLIERNGYMISADARIDNREELISELEIERISEQHVSDGELILKAFFKWGEDSPTRLLGDFAFAIWDTTSRSLFCARDHIGAKPFFYYFDRHTKFVFASEIKAIFCHSEVPRAPSENKLVDFLLADFGDRSATFFAHIFRLPPASTLTLRERNIKIRQYWALDPEQEIRLASDAEYAESFREIFTEAVRCRLRSDFPVGCMLSGGLDSSSIACVAHDLSCTKRLGSLHTFSIIFDKTKQSDERTHISQVLRSRQFQSHSILGDPFAPFDDLDKVLWHQDEPFFAPNLFLNRQVWDVARESGVRVLLDGLLGDNVVSHGIEYLNELAYRWRWIRLARELGQIIETAKLNVPLLKPWLGYVLARGIRPFVHENIVGLLRRVRGKPPEPWAERMRVFARDFADRADVRSRLTRLYRQEQSPRNARRAHADALQSGMIETGLEIYNRGCAEFGIETRFPFADKRVVEFCLAIPGPQKISRGYPRMILRRALAGQLPDSIRWRTDKGDLGWSFLDGLARSADLVDSRIRSSRDFLRRFINLSYVDRRLARLREGVATEVEAELFYIAVLSAWQASYDA